MRSRRAVNIAGFSYFYFRAIFRCGGRPRCRSGLEGKAMRWLIAILAVALTAASAQAQLGSISPGSNIGQSVQRAQDKANEAAKSKVDDKAYNSALRNLPDKQFDPWRGVR